MSFTAFTNIITILFCLAVLVQSVRMMRSLNQVRESHLDRTVGALDTATAKARGVLSELKETLTTEGAANARALAEAKEVREELNVMVGIANAMAERLIEAASAKPAEAPKPAQPARPRTQTSRGKAAKPTSDKPAKAKTPRTTKPAKSSGDAAGATRQATARKASARSTRETAELLLDAKEMA